MWKRYPIRVLKYFLFLVVLFAVLFGAMLIFNMTSWDMFRAVWGTSRVWILLVLFVGLPLVRPLFAYGTRDVRGNMDEKRNVVERVLATCGYTVTENRPDRIVAHARGIKKVSLLFEDRLTITPEGNHYLRVEGPKKEIVKFESRMRSFMSL